MERVDQLTEAPVVGRYYMVPCVRFADPRFPGWWPVIGPPHEDPDLGAPVEHYHHDVRFLAVSQLERIYRDMKPRFWERQWRAAKTERRMVKLAMEAVPYVEQAVEAPTLRRRLCRRKMPAQALSVARRIQDAYADKTAKCGTCPHRGFPLAGAPVVKGARVCPGHGLAWDVETGRLVRR